jgi:energy-coupling factor transport system substrate-specific component
MNYEWNYRFFQSVVTREGIIAIIIAIALCIVARSLQQAVREAYEHKDGRRMYRAALYAALSAISVPIGRIFLPYCHRSAADFGAFFDQTAGFLIGFIGHALNDAFMYGGVWWSWVFLSAMMGLFAASSASTRSLTRSADLHKANVAMMYIWSIVGMFVGSVIAYCGDVYLYGEPPEKCLYRSLLQTFPI